MSLFPRSLVYSQTAMNLPSAGNVDGDTNHLGKLTLTLGNRELIAKGNPSAPQQRNRTSPDEIANAVSSTASLGKYIAFHSKRAGKDFVPQPRHFASASALMERFNVPLFPRSDIAKWLPADIRGVSSVVSNDLKTLRAAGYGSSANSPVAAKLALSDAIFEQWKSEFGSGSPDLVRSINDLLAARKSQLLTVLGDREKLSRSNQGNKKTDDLRLRNEQKLWDVDAELGKLQLVLRRQLALGKLDNAGLRVELDFFPPKTRGLGGLGD